MEFSNSKPPALNLRSIVFVVDDDAVVRGGLSSLLRSAGYVVQDFENPPEMLEHPLVGSAGCLLLDVRLRGYSGFDVQQQVTEAELSMPVIFMSGHGDVPMSVRAMKAGAVDFLVKPFRHQDVLDSVAKALAKHHESLARQREFACLCARYECLTPREKQVMGGVYKGLMNKQIAGELSVSEVTVKVHRANTMRKMRVSTIADLVRAGQRLNLA